MSIFSHLEDSGEDIVLTLWSWEVGMGEAFAHVPKTENPEDRAHMVHRTCPNIVFSVEWRCWLPACGPCWAVIGDRKGDT